MPTTALDFWNQGNLFFMQSRYQDAINSYKQATKLHTEYDEAWNNLSVTYTRSGMLNQATIARDIAIKCYLKNIEALNKEHPDQPRHEIAAVYNNLANAYSAAGEFGKAIECHNKSIGIMERLMGYPVKPLFTAINNLANTYHTCMKFDEEIDTRHKILEFLQKIHQNQPCLLYTSDAADE